MKHLYTTAEGLGFIALLFAISCETDSARATAGLALIAVAGIILMFAGMKGEEHEKSCKVHDHTTRRGLDASRPSFLRK